MQQTLKIKTASIEHGPRSRTGRPVVKTGTPLGDVLQKCLECDSDHVLVVDEDGSLFGVASLAAIGDFVRDRDNDILWQDRPVESIVMLPFSTETSDNLHNSRDYAASSVSECLSVFEEEQLVALMTGSDSLLSWNRIEQAVSHAATDPVTLLPNRAHYDRRLAEEWDRALRIRTSIGIAIIDVDYFKEVNDQFGHNEGDRVLRSIAECCREQLRSYDLLARHGGDELAGIFCAQKPEELDFAVARLLSAVNNVSLAVDGSSRLSLSIGMAIARPCDGDCSWKQLAEHADVCLYESKRKGRNQAHLMTLNNGTPEQKRQILPAP